MDSIMLSTEMMMFEILSRTSLKTLDTIRCANKEFDTITYNSFFIDLYKKRNNIVSGFLVQNQKGALRYINRFVPSPQSETIDLQKVLPRDARILASSEQGIIFMESKDHLNPMKVLYHLCKPTTLQFLEVPNPNLGYVTQKAAIVVMGLKPLRFKIVRLSERLLPSLGPRVITKYYYEIFDSKTQAWRPPCPILTFPAGAFLDDAQEPITTRGSINMLLNNNSILKFDVYSEEWTIFSSPIPTRKYQDYTSKKLVKFEGKLGLTCKSPDGSLKMWVRAANQSWKSLYVINKKEDIDRKSLEALYDSETSVMVDSDGLEFYRFKKGLNTNKVVLNNRPTRMFVFRSDFEPIENLR